jgi:ubiquinone/menaquinone biosynthesis C-methylase UbiE
MSTDEKSITWYNENSASYAKHVRDPQDSIYHSLYEKPAMYNLVPDIKGKRVLSLGCGSGEDSSYLKVRGAVESVGIDISKNLIDIALESYPDCMFHVMDMEGLTLKDEEFDFVYSSLAIHYIEDWTKVFSEVFRVLKPGSNFLFSCNSPVKSAMVMTLNDGEKQVRQFSLIKYKNPKSVEIIGDYLTRKITDDGLGNLGDVTIWHKSLSEILGEATKVGFVLDKFVEPKPLAEMEKISERDFIKLSKIPEFMILRLLKPEAAK